MKRVLIGACNSILWPHSVTQARPQTPQDIATLQVQHVFLFCAQKGWSSPPKKGKKPAAVKTTEYRYWSFSETIHRHMSTHVHNGLSDCYSYHGSGVPRAVSLALQVKSENGKDTFVLKLRSGDTVATVRQYLDKQRPHGTGGYKLVSAYPRKELTNDMTLDDAGLTPRATIRMIANKK